MLHNNLKSPLKSFVIPGAALLLAGAAMVFSAVPPQKAAGGTLYNERYRPQFHFTPKTNWTNDPNGLVFYAGEYHLFFQHNPAGIDWGNMTWGHAVGPDLLHWKQMDHALYPDSLGTIFSGSAVVDRDNTASFQDGPEKTIVCIFTSAGGTSPESKGRPFTQSLAYSTDRGRTWKKFAGNPVLGHISGGNRDPKVLWHAPSRRWVMALYLDDPKTPNAYALFSSPNLKEWTRLCTVEVPGATECPDFFELPVDGDPKNTRWVFWGASNDYVLGRFDGKDFKREAGPFKSHWGANRYAAQTYSDIPSSDGRRIQLAWMSGGKYPEMPFNQQFTFPAALTLRTFPEGVRLCTHPIRELASLHKDRFAWKGTLEPGANPLKTMRGELFDIRLAIEPGKAASVGLNVRGVPIKYDVREGTLTCLGKSAPVGLSEGRLTLQVLVDRSSIEIFAADGRVNMAFCFLPGDENKTLSLFAEGGAAEVRAFDIWDLKSVY
jgi:sucrose-6-phosphate hydrolase SacC (GH32 family)